VCAREREDRGIDGGQTGQLPSFHALARTHVAVHAPLPALSAAAAAAAAATSLSSSPGVRLLVLCCYDRLTRRRADRNRCSIATVRYRTNVCINEVSSGRGGGGGDGK
jgi:hypothetical protein